MHAKNPPQKNWLNTQRQDLSVVSHCILEEGLEVQWQSFDTQQLTVSFTTLLSFFKNSAVPIQKAACTRLTEVKGLFSVCGGAGKAIKSNHSCGVCTISAGEGEKRQQATAIRPETKLRVNHSWRKRTLPPCHDNSSVLLEEYKPVSAESTPAFIQICLTFCFCRVSHSSVSPATVIILISLCGSKHHASFQ